MIVLQDSRGLFLGRGDVETQDVCGEWQREAAGFWKARLGVERRRGVWEEHVGVSKLLVVWTGD